MTDDDILSSENTKGTPIRIQIDSRTFLQCGGIMPRQERIDGLWALHHLIIRGLSENGSFRKPREKLYPGLIGNVLLATAIPPMPGGKE
jgi:hypothetical protein